MVPLGRRLESCVYNSEQLTVWRDTFVSHQWFPVNKRNVVISNFSDWICKQKAICRRSARTKRHQLCLWPSDCFWSPLTAEGHLVPLSGRMGLFSFFFFMRLLLWEAPVRNVCLTKTYLPPNLRWDDGSTRPLCIIQRATSVNNMPLLSRAVFTAGAPRRNESASVETWAPASHFGRPHVISHR